MQKWFIVASLDTVKIFETDLSKKKIKQINKLENPLGREKNRNLVRKQAGVMTRSIGRIGTARYTAMGKNDPHRDAAIQFAKQISKFLHKESAKNKFDELTIFAEPHFMGKIKSEMSNWIDDVNVTWVRKNLQKSPKLELKKVLLSS